MDKAELEAKIAAGMRPFGKPMLADNKPFDEAKVKAHLPLWGSVKLDGIRILVNDGVGYSRSLKPLPNRDLQRKVKANEQWLNGFDGEIIIGDPAAEDCYQKTFSAVMAEHGEHDHRFFAFDAWFHKGTYETRYAWMHAHLGFAQDLDWVEVLQQTRLESMDDVFAYAEANFAAGYEGSILRDPRTLYKNGRATTNQGQLYKMKKWVDTEVEIVGFEELMHNDNAAYTNETGYTQRSSHQENKRGGDTLGAFLCKGAFDDGTPYDVRVGTMKGVTQGMRKEIWDARESYLGRLIKIKYMAVGVKDAPRHPVFLGFRDPMDM